MSAPCACCRRRRAAGARRARLPARRRTTAVGEVLTCDSATEALRTLHERGGRRGLPRHPDARAHRPRARPGADAASGRRRRRLRHRPRGARRRRVRAAAVDYVLKPVRADRLAEAVRRVVEGGDRAPGRARRADPGRARRRDPLRRPLRGAPTSRRRATTRGCTPRTARTCIRVPLTTLEDGVGRRRLRPHPPLAAGRARARRPRSGWRPAAARCGSATAPSSAVSRRHTRELRELLPAARPDRSDGRDASPPDPGPGHRPAAPPAPPGAADRATSTSRAAARRGLPRHRCSRAQLRLAVRILVVLALTVGSLPLLFRVFPGLAEVARRSGCRWPGCCSASGLPVAGAARAGATSRRAERNERDFVDSPAGRSDEDVPVSLDGVAAGCRRGRVVASPRWRSAPTGCGSRAPPATSSSPRASSTRGSTPRAIGGEYLSAASFLGVAGLVLTSGADMLWYPVGWTAGYLVLLVLVAAPLRRVGRLHAARLRRGPAGVAAGPRGSARCSSWRSAGSTCCRSSRAPA